MNQSFYVNQNDPLTKTSGQIKFGSGLRLPHDRPRLAGEKISLPTSTRPTIKRSQLLGISLYSCSFILRLHAQKDCVQIPWSVLEQDYVITDFGSLGRLRKLKTEVCSLLEWCFIISIGVSSDHSQLRCTGFAGSH